MPSAPVDPDTDRFVNVLTKKSEIGPLECADLPAPEVICPQKPLGANIYSRMLLAPRRSISGMSAIGSTTQGMQNDAFWGYGPRHNQSVRCKACSASRAMSHVLPREGQRAQFAVRSVMLSFCTQPPEGLPQTTGSPISIGAILGPLTWGKQCEQDGRGFPQAVAVNGRRTA